MEQIELQRNKCEVAPRPNSDRVAAASHSNLVEESNLMINSNGDNRIIMPKPRSMTDLDRGENVLE